MTQNFLADLKTTLENCIAELDELHFMFCQNPEADFTGNRKLSFHDYIQFMVQMQSKSVSNEILDFFEHSLAAPAKSSFTQQHFKLQPEGWSFLFHIFVEQCRELSDQPYHGYRLLACDGSDVNIARDPEDERTFIHEGEKGYNAIHVNALYDIMNHITEQYFSGDDDNTTDYIAEGLMRSLIHSSRIAVKDPENYEARSNIMWTATWALNTLIAKGKTTYDWAVYWRIYRCYPRYDIVCRFHSLLSCHLPLWSAEIQTLCHECMGCESRRQN